MNAPLTAKSTQKSEIYNALSSFDKPALRHYQENAPKADLSHIPGGRGMPVIGHTYWFLKDIHGWLNRQHAQYGNVFKMRIRMLESVYLLGPDANRLVFQNTDKIFSNFLAWDTVFDTLFDNNILERDFANHKSHRKILQLAFKRPAIEGHIELMNPLLAQGLLKWPTDKPINTMDHIKELLLDTGSSVFLGLEPGPESRQLNTAFTNIVAATADPFRRKEIWFSPYAKGVKASKLLSDHIMKYIPERRERESRDLFSQFCHLRDDEGKLFSDEEIRDHIIFLLFAAHDTTTSALSAVLFALASNQEWQEELRQEMHDIDKAEIAFEDVAAMVKTGWTFKEALRMYPALSMMPRYALQDFEFEGHRIPANTIVMASSVFTHYMPEYWSNPHTFDPERFSPERAEDKKDLFQYIPFGGGAHKCLGMHFAEVQGKMFLFHLLKNFRVTKNPKNTQYHYNNVPMTFPNDGLPLTFHKL
jgi:cytochrome P450